MIDTVAAKGGDVIVDEIYQGLNYDDAPLSATSLSDDAFVVNSFSKYFGMTGWRLGWLVAPEQAVEPLTRLAQNVFLAAPTLPSMRRWQRLLPSVGIFWKPVAPPSNSVARCCWMAWPS